MVAIRVDRLRSIISSLHHLQECFHYQLFRFAPAAARLGPPEGRWPGGVLLCQAAGCRRPLSPRAAGRRGTTAGARGAAARPLRASRRPASGLPATLVGAERRCEPGNGLQAGPGAAGEGRAIDPQFDWTHHIAHLVLPQNGSSAVLDLASGRVTHMALAPHLFHEATDTQSR